jgi:hypothetical protein
MSAARWDDCRIDTVRRCRRCTHPGTLVATLGARLLWGTTHEAGNDCDAFWRPRGRVGKEPSENAQLIAWRGTGQPRDTSRQRNSRTGPALAGGKCNLRTDGCVRHHTATRVASCHSIALRPPPAIAILSAPGAPGRPPPTARMWQTPVIRPSCTADWTRPEAAGQTLRAIAAGCQCSRPVRDVHRELEAGPVAPTCTSKGGRTRRCRSTTGQAQCSPDSETTVIAGAGSTRAHGPSRNHGHRPIHAPDHFPLSECALPIPCVSTRRGSPPSVRWWRHLVGGNDEARKPAARLGRVGVKSPHTSRIGRCTGIERRRPAGC